MNFDIDEDQLALGDSLKRLLADRCGFEQRRGLLAGGASHAPATWAALVELGITALPLPAAHGGFGGGAREWMPVQQALAGALSLEPLLPTVLAATAMREAADDALQASMLPGVAAGTTRLAWAHDEPAGRHAPLWIETRAQRKDGRWVLNGIKSPVPGAALAHRLVVTARVAGESGDADGCALFLLDPRAARAALREFRLVDDTGAGELTMRDAPAQPLHDPFDSARAAQAIRATVNAGIAAACADMVGAAQAAFDLAMDYVRTRKQFGRFIGENQALRHRAADMLVSLEMARSMAIAAAVAADDPSGEESQRDLHRAKYSVGRHARLVAHGAIQLHGGIGMTEEHAVGHYLRRIHVFDQWFGDGEAHVARLAA
jgi:pimeloyl-CoA dehydrogenase